MKIGLIQTRGIGDIIIALPIAKYLVDRGHAVVWRIHAPYVRPFREKWNLQIVRNRAREEALFARVVREPQFVVCHLEGSHFRANLDVEGMAAG